MRRESQLQRPHQFNVENFEAFLDGLTASLGTSLCLFVENSPLTSPGEYPVFQKREQSHLDDTPSEGDNDPIDPDQDAITLYYGILGP